ncbi:type VI secretion system baseplate subunit TssK [Duganella sp. FT3S]|uniref:Type VI secretion system baseplate subunit TssK n=1 Tax=Rugamonas fusca TaxID=2758568 RepID=A0A7W2I7B9_9BURK|nr:type VI secretion system baseplate subunit TssK [Rugamonas fusca]MBA5606336.1 type VI secretion system baseplate subunit TssK [Rugamonas fusca]
MRLPPKVLWSEGLPLGPQQLQQLDRYHEARLQRTVAALRPHLWGVCALQWDSDGLANNRLTAETLALIFPDGELYEAPASCPLPLTVDLSGLPLETQSFTFHAALSRYQDHGSNVINGAANGARYAPVERDTPDLYSDAASVGVSYLQPHVRLLSDLDALTDCTSVPVARVRRLAGGGFELDPDYLPPSVTVAAAPWLAQRVDRLLGKLGVKIEALYSRHRQSSRNVIEVHSGDIASFWMLSTLNTAGAGLTHFARYGQHHPEALFERLMTLAGGLLTFSQKYALADLPAYDHADPGPGFARLDAIIRDLVDTVISSRYVAIALAVEADKPTHHMGTLDAARVGRDTALCLAVQADMAPLELVAAVPRLLKAGAPDDVERAIQFALPGVELTHMPQVPPQVPVRPNTYYFSIEGKGPLYENMLKAEAIAVYAPINIKSLKLELFAIAT